MTNDKQAKMTGNDYAYSVVTERFVKFIEEHKELPWRKPWMVVQPEVPPMNYRTKTVFKGVNVFMCLMSGFSSPYWLTYNQAKDMGGYVRKGESGTPIVKWNPPDKQKLDAIDADESLTDEQKAEKKRKVFGFYRVSWEYNALQIEGIEFPQPEPVEVRGAFNPIQEAEKVIEAMPNKPAIRHDEPSAYYNPMLDFVNLPACELFESEAHYYATLFHEIAHSTGHKDRLGRFLGQQNAAFGSKDYSFEELVAELASSFSLNELGIENRDTVENSAAYLAGWLKKLKSDTRMLLKAMNKAIPATNYIFNRIEAKEA